MRKSKSKFPSLCKHFKFPSSCEATTEKGLWTYMTNHLINAGILFFLDVKKLLLGK